MLHLKLFGYHVVCLRNPLICLIMCALALDTPYSIMNFILLTNLIRNLKPLSIKISLRKSQIYH